MECLLEDFFNENRIDKKSDVCEFWGKKKLTNSCLYSLAVTVLALPVTQVSCERALSGLKYILNDLCSNMTEDVLEDILIIRANENLRANKWPND